MMEIIYLMNFDPAFRSRAISINASKADPLPVPVLLAESNR